MRSTMSDSPFAADVQTAAAVLMAAASLFLNEQTAASNTFQVAPDASKEVVAAQADAEFAGLQALLVAAGISVRVFDDPGEPHTPDAVFPNNWFSTHPDGTLVLYPMAAPNRRAERRPGWIAALQAELGATRLLDLSPHEDAGRFWKAPAAWFWIGASESPTARCPRARIRRSLPSLPPRWAIACACLRRSRSVGSRSITPMCCFRWGPPPR